MVLRFVIWQQPLGETQAIGSRFLAGAWRCTVRATETALLGCV